MKFQEKLLAMQEKAQAARNTAFRMKDDYLWNEHKDLWNGKSGRGKNEETWRKHLGTVDALEHIVYGLSIALQYKSVAKMKASLHEVLINREEWIKDYHDQAWNPQDWGLNELGAWSAEASEGVMRHYCKQIRDILGIWIFPVKYIHEDKVAALYRVEARSQEEAEAYVLAHRSELKPEWVLPISEDHRQLANGLL